MNNEIITSICLEEIQLPNVKLKKGDSKEEVIWIEKKEVILGYIDLKKHKLKFKFNSENHRFYTIIKKEE